MLKATFFIQREGGGKDDIIRMYEDEHELIRIVYTCPEFSTRKSREMHVTMSKAVDYIGDLMKSLWYDTLPFAYFQVSTMVHPSVVYRVSDLNDYEVRHLIQDMTEMALRQSLVATNA
jgi:hypothetical protein